MTLVITGVLNGDYELIRDLVRYICTSCLGLGWAVKINIIRVIIQILSLVIVNLGINIVWKTGFICPFLYCYGCPLAVSACPIGVLQNYVALGRLPLYPAGAFGIYGLAFGRFFCGWCCPFGAFQDLLGKLGRRKLFKPRPVKFVKYVILLGVLILAWLTADTFFCKLCPSGSLFAAIPFRILYPELSYGFFFNVHVLTLAVLVFLFLLVGRFWCSYLCPFSPVLGSFNSISLVKIHRDLNKCTECGICLKGCPMNIQNLEDIGLSSDCIRCGLCIDNCPEDALQIKIRH